MSSSAEMPDMALHLFTVTTFTLDYCTQHPGILPRAVHKNGHHLVQNHQSSPEGLETPPGRPQSEELTWEPATKPAASTLDPNPKP